MAILQQVNISDVALDQFCHRWKIAKLEHAGFFVQTSSEITLLVTFTPDAQWSLLDHVRMEGELAELSGHKVDLVTRRAVEQSGNVLRKNAILGSIDPRPLYPPS